MKTKFRALKDDMSNCNFVYGNLIYDESGNPRIQENENLAIFTTCLKNTESQFTGLKDKNKKEIFEGDIVKSFYKNNFEYFAIVELDICNPCFVLNPINYKFKYHIEYDFIACNLRTLEIIGNKLKNPELLKK